MRILELSTTAIVEDDTYSLSYPSRPGRYEGVAERFPGLPLLVVNGSTRVVCGHDYLQLLRGRGQERVSALQVDLSAAECLLLNGNILDLLFGLNLYEKLLLVDKISPLLPRVEIQRRAGLGFSLSDILLESLPLLLGDPFRTCLAAGRLGLKTALKLAGQQEADRLAQLRLFHACSFSESEQWRLAQLLEEIAFREKKPLEVVLADCGLSRLLEGEMPQKRIIDALQAIRYPELTRMEKDWRAWRDKAAAAGLAASHAPFFASEEIQVTLTLKNRSQAEKLLANLKNFV